MPTRESKILAREHFTSDASQVQSAESLAVAALATMNRFDVVVIDLEGLRGASSTFFNVLLSKIADAHGSSGLSHRLRFECQTMAQRMALERSMRSVSKASSPGP